MTLPLLAFLGGLLTILSPCILPVLPFVFSRAGQPIMRSGLPMLAGMALTFATIASLAAVGGSWAAEANQYGRILALGLLALFATTLLWGGLAQMLARPLVALGSRLSIRLDGKGPSTPLSSFLLGVATGFLWAPCAGPILGLVLTGAAINGASAETSLLLLSYAAGAATALAAALIASGRLLAVMKRLILPGEWLRRGLGVAVLAAVVAIAAGWDTRLLAQVDVASTARIEEALIARIAAEPAIDIVNAMPALPRPQSGLAPKRSGSLVKAAYDGSAVRPSGVASSLPIEGRLPGFAGATEWLNGSPLTAEALRGKVVLVNFWTFQCYNCLNALPHVQAWAEKYRDHGLVVVGVHSPEFPFEKVVGNVRDAMKRLDIRHPVAIDNNFAIWKAFNNRYWPANYFVDAQGNIRYHHFGEHDYENSERVIQELLREAGYMDVPGGIVSASIDRAQGRTIASIQEVSHD